MINKRKKECIKDVLIDHVFDFCFNEIVQRVEGGGMKLTYDDPVHLKDPTTADILKQIKKSENIKAYYTTRETDYCEILTESHYLHSALIKKLKFSGFSKGKFLSTQVLKAQDFLIARSYFACNNPIKNKVKLTEKGRRHYLDGKSFEDKYVNRRNSNLAIVISVFSIIISLVAIFAN